MNNDHRLDDRLCLALNAATEMVKSLTGDDPMSPELRGLIWRDLESELMRTHLSLDEALRLYRQQREAARSDHDESSATTHHTRPEEV